MTAHLCAHSGVCSAPQTGWAQPKSGGKGGHRKKNFPAPEFVPTHFQFASGASGSAEALVRCGTGNYRISYLLSFSVTHVPNIMKIRQCFLELLKMSVMFFWDTVYIYLPS